MHTKSHKESYSLSEKEARVKERALQLIQEHQMQQQNSGKNHSNQLKQGNHVHSHNFTSRKMDPQHIDFYNNTQVARDGQINMRREQDDQNVADQSRSSTSSTTTEDEARNIDSQIQNLITQVKKLDAESQQIQAQSKTNQPLIYSVQNQPSPQQLKQIAMQLRQQEITSPKISEQSCQGLLPPKTEQNRNKKTLVLDLDETLVHSSFKPIDNADIVQPVEIDGTIQYVYVLKRPLCEEFIKRMSKSYEIVMFTASLSKYAEPLYSQLDKNKVSIALLFREHCSFYNGIFVKDMSKLGRSLNDVIIIDNSPSSYLFQPENALPCTSWYDDKNDRELNDLVPILEKLAQLKDVRPFLKEIVENNQVNFNKAHDLIKRCQINNPEEDNKKVHNLKIFTPDKGHQQRGQSSSKSYHPVKQSTPIAHSSQPLSTATFQILNQQTNTPKLTISQSKIFSHCKDPNNKISSSHSQANLQQNQVHHLKVQRSSAQLEDHNNNNLLINTWTTQKHHQNEDDQSLQSSQNSQKYQSQDSQPRKALLATPSKFINSHQNRNEQDNDNRIQSREQGISLSDQKYQEYMKSLQKHQRRSESQPSHVNQNQQNIKDDIKPAKLTTLENDSGVIVLSKNQIQQRANERSSIDNHKSQGSKRSSSAQVKDKQISQSTTKKNRPSSSQVSSHLQANSPRSYAKGESHSHQQSLKDSGMKQSSSKIAFNLQGTPERPKSSKNKATPQSAHATPKYNSSNRIGLSIKRDSSLTIQKNQELRKNFSSLMKNIESSNPSIGSQSTQDARSHQINFKDPMQQSNFSPINKFIAKFENFTPNPLQQNQEIKMIQSLKINQTSNPHIQKQPQSSGTDRQNKNHLQYSSIYAKLSQANSNLSNQNSGGTVTATSGFSSINYPIKASQSTANLISMPSGSVKQMSQSSNSSSTVNLIALQMLKNAQPPLGTKQIQ